MPVRTGATQVAYVKDAQWVEVPTILFARLLSETIAAKTGRVVLDPKQFTFDPGQRLTGTLQTFGLDADRMEAVLVYDAAVSRGKECGRDEALRGAGAGRRPRRGERPGGAQPGGQPGRRRKWRPGSAAELSPSIALRGRRVLDRLPLQPRPQILHSDLLDHRGLVLGARMAETWPRIWPTRSRL